MAKFPVQCTLCGSSFGCERDFDTHPCLKVDVKVPFGIKLEENIEEEKLEDTTEWLLQQVSGVQYVDVAEVSDNEEKSPDLMDFKDKDPLDFTEHIAEGTNNGESGPVHKVTDAVSIRNNCGVCGKLLVKQADVLEHRGKCYHNPRSYECNVCKENFTDKHSVTLHMRVHVAESQKRTLLECKFCGRLFSNSENLIAHFSARTAEKPYVCGYCGKCFKHRGDHKVHVSQHTGMKPYKCTICGIGFRHNTVLRHMRTHMGIKDYKCGICNVYCATPVSISGHIDLHHGDLKKVDVNAPEVQNSITDLLNMEAPQPAFMYKQVATLTSKTIISKADSSSREIVTNASGVGVENSINASEASFQSKGDRAKSLSYKEFIEQQEKILTNKNLTVNNPQKKCDGTNSTAYSLGGLKRKYFYVESKVTNLASLGQNSTLAASNSSQAVASKQTIIPSQNSLMSEAVQIIPHSASCSKHVKVLNNSRVNSTDPRVAPQSSLVGGRPIVMLSPESRSIVLLPGGGSSPHRVVMPNKPTANSGTSL